MKIEKDRSCESNFFDFSTIRVSYETTDVFEITAEFLQCHAFESLQFCRYYHELSADEFVFAERRTVHNLSVTLPIFI